MTSGRLWIPFLALSLLPGTGRAAENPPGNPDAAFDNAVQSAPSADSAAPIGSAESRKPYGFGQIWLDAKYLATRPAHLERDGKIKIALTVGTTALLYLYREDIRDWVQDRRNPQKDQFLNTVRTMGKAAFAPSLSLIAYGASFLTHDEREKETSVLLLESMGFTGIAAGTCQFILATERPEDGTDIKYFAPNGHGCSGDAALAASVVPILSRQYLEVFPQDSGAEKFWKVSGASLLYAGAFLTGYQRMNDDKHWAPDVFLGLVAGFSVGQMLEDSHQRTREGNPRLPQAMLIPGGAALRFRF